MPSEVKIRRIALKKSKISERSAQVKAKPGWNKMG